MSDQKGQHEPSMEEILASIRRIIAEDGEQPAAAPAKEAPPAAASPRPDEILELTEVVEEERGAKPASVAMAEPEPRPQPQPPAVEPGEPAGGLVSDAAAAASLAALSQLKQLGERREQRMSDIPLGEGPRTIEGLVREMLRPLLKEWLDSNLPDIVERIVHEEVDRLVRASRGR
jgi:cell pole-organizing protein PopZ